MLNLQMYIVFTYNIQSSLSLLDLIICTMLRLNHVHSTIYLIKSCSFNKFFFECIYMMVYTWLSLFALVGLLTLILTLDFVWLLCLSCNCQMNKEKMLCK